MADHCNQSASYGRLFQAGIPDGQVSAGWHSGHHEPGAGHRVVMEVCMQAAFPFQARVAATPS